MNSKWRKNGFFFLCQFFLSGGGMDSYLGIPMDISGSKQKLFAFVKERLQNQVSGWTGWWLSRRGKYVLIKSILLVVPTYVMSTLLLPVETCENLVSSIVQFLWSLNPLKRGIHWQNGKSYTDREKKEGLYSRWSMSSILPY